MKDIGCLGYPYFTHPRIVWPAKVIFTLFSVLTILFIGIIGYRFLDISPTVLWLSPLILSFSETYLYYSQQYFVGGFSWNWNSALGFSNANNRIDDETDSQQNASLSLSHSFNRTWSIGRTSTFNFAFTQNGSVSKSSEVDEATLGIGHGVGIGWSRRGVSSGSFANLSMSDSRTTGEQDTTFQQLNAQLTQRNVLSRVSALSANVIYQLTRQELPDNEEPSEPQTMTASLSYTNSRAFGIYALRFSTRLAYNKRLDRTTSGSETTESDNRLDYRVGLLTTSLTYRIMQVQGGTLSENINFSLTRTF